MNDEIHIKIIRLNTGEDIIAHCINDEANGTMLLSSPMRVVVRRMSETTTQSMLIMMPWLPLEIIEEDLATINHQDIITVVDPKDSFIEYYSNTVEDYKNLIDSKSDDELFSSEFEEDEEYDEETVQEMLDLLKEKKNKSIH
jgi:hypothetical protein